MRYSNRVTGPSISRPRGPQSSEPSIEATTDAEQHLSYAPSFAPLREYIVAVVGVATLTVACWLLTPLTGYGAISLIFLLGVLLAGMVLNRGPVVLVAALSALSWNFLFIPPLFTLHIAKIEDALTFATYFIIAITVGSLTAQLKAREHLAAQVQVAVDCGYYDQSHLIHDFRFFSNLSPTEFVRQRSDCVIQNHATLVG